MTNIVQFEPHPVGRHHFGGCPVCGNTDGYLNIGGNHWFVCHLHRMRWCAGYNLFSSWHDEDDSVWRENWRRIGNYHDCRPMPQAPDAA